MVQNPEPSVMKTYIAEGRAAAFSTLAHVQHLLKIETMLADATRLCAALASAVSAPASPAPERYVLNINYSNQPTTTLLPPPPLRLLRLLLPAV